MRGRKMILAAAACSGLAAGCAQKTPEAPAIDLVAEAQAIRDRSAAWLQMAAAKDVSGIVNSVYSASAVTLFDGEIRKGSSEIQTGMEAEFARMPDATISWTTTDVQVAASGDLAYELGSFTMDPDGAGETPAAEGEFLTVWSKVDGSWRAVADAGTTRAAAEDAPAAAPPAG
jgi:uncharacterized protein (TIGR02246 family)